jgi:hypothetical protein
MSVDPVDPQERAQLSEEDQQKADAKRYAKLMRTIAWLDALPNTAIPDVVAAQRLRLTEELREVALRRLRPRKSDSPMG